jgi:hypothetical protein
MINLEEANITDIQFMSIIGYHHRDKVTGIKELAKNCWKFTMGELVFKAKMEAGARYQIKTNKGIYSTGEFNQILTDLEESKMTPFELFKKYLPSVNFKFHYIDDGLRHKRAGENYNYVQSLIKQCENSEEAFKLWDEASKK